MIRGDRCGGARLRCQVAEEHFPEEVERARRQAPGGEEEAAAGSDGEAGSDAEDGGERASSSLADELRAELKELKESASTTREIFTPVDTVRAGLCAAPRPS